MQGTIVKVLVEKGQEVRPGDVICILEAMKMENHVPSTRDGEVTDLPIHAGQVVETGQVLAVIDQGDAPQASRPTIRNPESLIL